MNLDEKIAPQVSSVGRTLPGECARANEKNFSRNMSDANRPSTEGSFGARGILLD